MNRAIIAGLVCASLAACTPHIRTATPPPDLLTCAGEPAAPSLPARDGTDAVQTSRDLMTLTYILAWRTAHGDCAGKLAGVREWAEGVR